MSEPDFERVIEEGRALQRLLEDLHPGLHIDLKPERRDVGV